MEHLLQPGVLLDERYRVDHVLGEGGFGITYAAENIRIGLKVAIKELFWRNHSIRNVAVSPEVMLSQAQDMMVFQEQKERFLREARILRDFSGLSGIVHVIDYFETNGTAYIVMECVEGETLSSVLSREGVMDAETLFRRALPLIESLDKIHQAGIIHRDISPDNIMIQADDTLTLIDFGAAREFAQEHAKPYTTIAKASYSPGEQYDKNGRQGPWTDVYSLCATLYHCIVGAAPVGAVQRMFLDELKSPSEMGVSLAPEYETILMKGLQLDTSKRYQSMRELAQAIRDALPEEKKPSSRGIKPFFIGLAVGLVCLTIAFGYMLWRQSRGEDKFRGIETERLRVTANEEMTASEFAEAQKKIQSWLDDFAGPDNYLMSVHGTDIDITLPLAVYEGREINETTVSSYNDFTHFDGKKPLQLYAQIQADWEAPQSSLISGKNQVRPEDLQGETLLLVFGTYEKLTRSAWVGLIMDIKTRLDALGTPYAFGTLYGDDQQFVVRLAPERVGRVILDTLCSRNLYISGEYSGSPSFSCYYNNDTCSNGITPLERNGQICGVRYTRHYDFNTDLEQLTRVVLNDGGSRVYLQSSNGFPIAEAAIDHVIEDGSIEFTEFCFTEFPRITSESQWVINYLDTLSNQTQLNTTCSLRRSQVLDEKGNVLFDEDPVDHYGVFVNIKQSEKELVSMLQTLSEETGYHVHRQVGGYSTSCWISLDLEVNDRLPEQVKNTVSELLRRHDFASVHSDDTIFLQLIDEQGSERCRVTISTRYDYDKGIIYNSIDAFFNESPRLAPYIEQLQRWWSEFDAGIYGMRKSEF